MEEPMSMILQGDITNNKVWIETTAYFYNSNYNFTKITRDALSRKGYTYYVPVFFFLNNYDLFRLATYEKGHTYLLVISSMLQDQPSKTCNYSSPVIFTNWRFIKKENANPNIRVITKAEIWCNNLGGRVTLNMDSIKEFNEFDGQAALEKLYSAVNDSFSSKFDNPTLESSSEDTIIAEYNRLLENVVLPKSSSSKKEKERKSMNTMTNFINKFNFGTVSNDIVKMTLYGPAFATGAGTYIAYDKTKSEYIDATEFQLPVDGLFYNVPIVAKDLNVGDFIKHPRAER